MQDELSTTRMSPGAGALSAEHYQSYEMAKANDSILGGDDIAQIRSYAAFARAQAEAIHKSIATMGEIDDVAQAKAEMNETSQTFARVSIYADTRIGEILRELPKAKGNQYQQSATVGTPTKAEAEKQAGISHAVAIDLQTLAANPEVVEAVIAKAEAEGRVVARKQALDAIKERDAAKRERDQMQRDLQNANSDKRVMQQQVETLKRQVAEKPKPEVVERDVVREVVPDDYNELKRQVNDLRREKNLYLDTNKTLRGQLESTRKELDQAKGILGMDNTAQGIRNDVQYLIIATNQYVKKYGGLTWTFEQLGVVDELTIEELRKAVKNLATFSSALSASLEHMND